MPDVFLPCLNKGDDETQKMFMCKSINCNHQYNESEKPNLPVAGTGRDVN